MSEKKIKYTVSIYTENSVGLLNRISAIFQKRHINIESFNSSITEIEDVQRWTILVHTSEILIKKIVGQINKQIEVIKSYYCLLYTSPSPRDRSISRMPSSA